MNIINITTNQVNISSNQKILTGEQYQLFCQAEELIEKANQQAKIIAEEAQKAFQEEKKRGYEEGMTQSRLEQSEQMLKMVDRTINYLAEIETTMADILMSAVKKIIENFDDRDMVIGLIRTALQHVRNQHEVTVRIPPSQYSHVKENIDKILADYKGLGFINTVSDSRLVEGGCILESKIGVIDASIDIQLEALQRRFTKLTRDTMGALAKSADIDSPEDD